MEEFGFLLVSHLSDKKEINFLSNVKIKGNEVDSILLLNDLNWGGDVLIEAKNKKKNSPRDVDQIFTRMYTLSIKYGFLLTKARLSGKEGQLGTIEGINAKEDHIIIPLQGPHIEEFLNSKEKTNDFLLRMIKISTYNPTSLEIE